MKIVLIVLAVVVGLVLAVEVGLRLLFGFGNPLIYIADEQIGYLLAPNQRTRRFGNLIEINQYSMRSPKITETRPESTLRVLLLGDSIANGGWWTDQAETLSAMMTQQLQSSIDGKTFKQIEVLNASANSWCPRNELAYLKQFGTFDAQVVVLLINTDDLFGTAPTSIPVGRDRNYPKQKPPLALVEAFSRYLLKPPPVPEMKAVNAESGDRVGFNLKAIQEIQTIAEQKGARFLLAMTPLKRELGELGSRDYELKARVRLIDLTQNQHIAYIDFLPIFNSKEQPENLYRDHIHLSPQGNQLVNEEIGRSLSQLKMQN
ncbi:GDSL-type esterase/lipase family protein [Coleofasciculus sp. FACHB-542]|uniref:GDSL-type esterase/lipase family protein n=1 Tax=Coleofasciculus sp. FACHB-542 TaxID=2692787 RepID=UPI0016824856|nr:SGNH/GDSL hydrolase family protein [Coleofasciculus sp. FACHB-542]